MISIPKNSDYPDKNGGPQEQIAPVSAPVETTKGKQNRWLRANSKMRKALGLENRERAWDLVVRQGMSISKAAECMGVSYQCVHKHYTNRFDELMEQMDPSGPNADRYRLELEEHLRDVLHKAKKKSADDPRYAAIVLKTLDQLAQLHGLYNRQEQPQTDHITAAELSDKLKLMSPALAGRKEQLERILADREAGR